MKPVVRFAPSPTGNLHIGGARTALFNYLFARRHGGTFLLRIEDTDRERSDEAFTRQILDALRWLQLDWDGKPVYQSDRMNRYREIIEALLEKDAAYPCFCTKEELEARRGDDPGWQYDRKCAHLDAEERKQRMRAGEAHVIRLRVPELGIQFTDLVRGTVTVDTAELEDFILARSDGSPVYQLTVVVDDHDMNITHVIRGEDHLSNTPKQILIYRAMGWQLPEFAHIPLILGPDKKRLSKRHGATSVNVYREAGFLPDALVNFLALLGWNPGDDREILGRDELIDLFSLDRVGKAGAVFDSEKAVWMNGQYIQSMDVNRLTELLRPFFEKEGWSIADEERVRGIVALLQPRARKLTDFVDQARFFFEAPTDYDEKGVRKHFGKPDVLDILGEWEKLLTGLDNFTEEPMETQLRTLAEERDQKAGAMIHPVRLALTGRTASPGIFETAVLLGRETCLERIRNAVAFIQSMPESGE